MEPTRFDDPDAVKVLAGDEFGDFGPPLEVTQQMIDGFAELTGDHQWIRPCMPTQTQSTSRVLRTDTSHLAAGCTAASAPT